MICLKVPLWCFTIIPRDTDEAKILSGVSKCVATSVSCWSNVCVSSLPDRSWIVWLPDTELWRNRSINTVGFWFKVLAYTVALWTKLLLRNCSSQELACRSIFGTYWQIELLTLKGKYGERAVLNICYLIVKCLKFD